MTGKSFITRDRVPFCCVVFLFVGGVFWEGFVQQLLHPPTGDSKVILS